MSESIGTVQPQPLNDRFPVSAREGLAAAGDTVGCSPAALFTRESLTKETRGQFGEVEHLVDLFNYYGVKHGWVVDVGCHDGVLYSNSAAFRQHGWNVVGIDAAHGPAEAARKVEPQFHCVIEAEVTPHEPYTLDWLIGGVGPVPQDFDLLTLDIDGFDYHVWKSLDKYRPRVVCIEIADFFGPFADGEHVPEFGKPIEQENTAGAPADYIPHRRVTTLLSMCKMAKEKGYTLVGSTRLNAVFVADEVIATKPIKLNLGAQGSFLPGFIHVDFISGEPVYPLPQYADGSVSEIYASHVLEHFSHRHTMDVLREWARVLEPDGKIRVAVPDFDKITDPKVVGDFNMRMMYLFGGHVDKNDRHGALFTRQSLEAQLRHVGIEYIQPWESTIGDCAGLPVSLNLGGVRRRFVKTENPAVVAVISQPRLTFSDASNALHRGLRAIANKAVFVGKSEPPILDDLIYCGGAFWEKSLTSGIKTAIRIGADYILFVDYDSIFHPNDPLALIDILDKDQSVTAAFAVQASRHHDAALVQMEYIKYEGQQTPVTLGHFGLTVIRASAFRDLPHPWLWSMPHPDTGEWDTAGHCDADITFWRILYEHGHKVVQVNTTQAGHMVLTVKWMTATGVMYQPIEHFRAYGRPKEAVFNAEALYKSRTSTLERRAKEAEQAKAMIAPTAEDHTIAAMRGAGMLGSGTEVPPHEHRNGSA